ncbi:AfsR/SARP family transcriptional regulator [Streptomyces nigrescens]|uniref:Winged helix-turn-helix domain-containing protein n=1 Tax=Streptomyces nigrescens TaxID=1920 RepID=A0ABY7IKN5_STRNI|nr:BTAD domain-containing putative transcriptional regulator [Streptomyces libani]WAT99367.1 winged helix-turn-helix domain-containing protein [Streptomyces libani subsp. libani]
MHYGILGTTQAGRADGTPVALGGARLRALLAALALRPGRALSPELLIGDIWGAEPPADAAGALQALVGRLRRALGHAAIASVDGGYRLCAEPDAVDLHRFERLATEGGRALGEADPARAAALLDDALALWRGPALADLPDASVEASRAERRRLDAQCTRIAADLALGRATQSLPTLLALCEDHPLDEPLQALRLHALRAAGRTAEALAAYEEIRTGLAERLGADPGPELRTLHAELLRPPPPTDRPPLAPIPGTPAAAPAPNGTGTSYGTGMGTSYGTGTACGSGTPHSPGTPSPGTSSTEPPHSHSHPHPHPQPHPHTRPGNLRARLTSFVGRDTDLAAIRADLAAHRLVTLLGPGGAGKTRLSQEGAETAAAALPDAWPHGVWLAELAPVDDPQTVPEAVLTALGARETVVRGTTADGLRAAADPTALDPLARLAEHCAGRRMLLVLDNCEHVIDAAAELAERLLADCPGVTVLATSREPLAVPGEVLRPVEPLPDPVALRLLADRGAAARPGFRVEDDPAACTEICRRLDGLPLAIELAAARLRLLSPRQLADRLDDRFRLLTSGSRTLLPRQQTLRAVVDWSWDLTDEPERAVLRRLSVFAGGCDLAAAEEVCAGDGVDGREVAGLLGSLIDKSLVVAAPAGQEGGAGRAAGTGGQMRYRLLETVGEYAGERLDEAGERAGAERRHLVAYRELARTTDPLLRGPGQRAGMERLELEHDNLRTALRRALAAHDEHEALCLVLSLQWFWSLRDHRSDARHWSTAAAALGPNPFAAPAEPAPDLHERPIDTPPPMAPEQLLEARREIRLVALASRDSDITALRDPAMQEELTGMLTAYRSGMPQTCKVPGVMWYYAVLITGEFDELAELVDGAVRACRDFGYDWELAYVLQLRSKIFNDRPGGLAQAARDADEALRLFLRLGDAWGAAEALSGRGENHEKRGAYGAAARDYRAAMVHAEDLGAHGQILLLRCRLGAVLIEDGQAEAGERMLREVLADAEKGNSVRDTEPFARLTLAMWLTATERLQEARAQLRRVQELFTSRAPDLFAGLLQALSISLDVDEGHREGLLPRFRQSLELMQDSLAQIVAPDLPVVQLLTGARVLMAERGEKGGWDAARLVGAYDAMRADGQVPPLLVRRDRDRTEAAARALLGDTAYARAHAEGGGLSLGEATALI